MKKIFSLFVAMCVCMLGAALPPQTKNLKSPKAGHDLAYTAQKMNKQSKAKAVAKNAAKVSKAVADEDYDLSAEPTQISQFDLKLTTLERYNVSDFMVSFDQPYQHIIVLSDEQGNTVALELWYEKENLEDATFTIKQEITNLTASKSLGMDVIFEEQTYCYAVINGNTYYLVEGTIDVKTTESGYQVKIDAKSAKGSTIKASYEGEISLYNFNGEPAEAVNLNFEADTATYYVVEDYENEAIAGYLIQLLKGTQYETVIYVVTNEQQIPTGTFPINLTGEKNTVMASLGSGPFGDEASYFYAYNEEELIDYTLYLTAGSVTISKNEKDEYVVAIDATSARGSSLKIAYTGTIDEYVDPGSIPTYDAEPTEVSNVIINPEHGYYMTIGDGGEGFILGFREGDAYVVSLLLHTTANEIPLGTFPIDFSADDNTIAASIGGYSAYDEYSYVWVHDVEGMYLYSYFLVSGSVTIATNENDDYVVTLNAQSYNGSTITMNYVGQIGEYGNEDPGYSFEDEPETTVNVEIYAQEYGFEQLGDGIYVVHLYAEPYHAQVLVLTEGEEPAGRYPFSDEEAVGFAKASQGGNEKLDDYSFVWLIEDDYWTTSYYLQTGYLDLRPDGENLLVTLEAESVNGSKFKIIYDATKAGLESVQTNDTQIEKLVRDGQVIILRNGKTYNVLGTELR